MGSTRSRPADAATVLRARSSGSTDLRTLAEQGAAELGPDATAGQVLAWGAATFGRGMIVEIIHA